jgi:hypothetical protein
VVPVPLTFISIGFVAASKKPMRVFCKDLAAALDGDLADALSRK